MSRNASSTCSCSSRWLLTASEIYLQRPPAHFFSMPALQLKPQRFGTNSSEQNPSNISCNMLCCTRIFGAWGLNPSKTSVKIQYPVCAIVTTWYVCMYKKHIFCTNIHTIQLWSSIPYWKSVFHRYTTPSLEWCPISNMGSQPPGTSGTLTGAPCHRARYVELGFAERFYLVQMACRAVCTWGKLPCPTVPRDVSFFDGVYRMECDGV